MNLLTIFQQFTTEIQHTSPLEFIGVVFGISSVLFSRKENILVYPVGMVSTCIYIYLYIKHGLYADASVNFYYTVMSIIGWVMWSRKRNGNEKLLISFSSTGEWVQSIIFFIACWGILFFVLKNFTDSTVPQADAFTSAAAFTGMLLMNKKKMENWIWWIVTNIASIPLNYYKGLAFTSFQYIVLLILAISGWMQWQQRYRKALL
ncbi:MAG: nicotinamide mononucleotide transporter [Sphingobacteriia bacterium]|nr:nicotinamide mononucleotide transporter [Sphingobacteriia bacterium]